MVRHLVGAGIGLVAVPVLIVLTHVLNDQVSQVVVRLDAGGGRGVLLLLIAVVLGAVVGVLCGGRLVSPVASLVSGAVLFVLNLVVWAPLVLGTGGRLIGGSLFFTLAGFGPMLLILAVVLLVASAWPSRWRGAKPPAVQPQPFPAPEVRP